MLLITTRIGSHVVDYYETDRHVDWGCLVLPESVQSVDLRVFLLTVV